VGAVLGDALRRVAVLGGREGMPRSLGSVYGGAVTRFLGGSLRGVARRVIDTPGVASVCNGVAVGRDGCSLLVSVGSRSGSDAVQEFSMVDGSRRRVIGGKGAGLLQFDVPRQVFVAPDGFVLVTDAGNHRVQVLTAALDFHGFIGEGQLRYPAGVCANADIIVVSDYDARCMSVWRRGDGTLVRRFGFAGSGDGQLRNPRGLCFMSGDRHVAVADDENDRVSVFSVDGEFIRHVGVGVLNRPQGVAASVFDELVVTDTGNRCLRLFSVTGDLLTSVGEGRFTGVAVQAARCSQRTEGRSPCSHHDASTRVD
jgi:DNA-binding beta-propeller fold protein YncE